MGVDTLRMVPCAILIVSQDTMVLDQCAGNRVLLDLRIQERIA